MEARKSHDGLVAIRYCDDVLPYVRDGPHNFLLPWYESLSFQFSLQAARLFLLDSVFFPSSYGAHSVSDSLRQLLRDP